MNRCCNIDWLEVHCLEPSFDDKRDANFFQRQGWVVRSREYGTRVYQEMFVLLEHGTSEPLIEVRRNPSSTKSKGIQVLEPLSCHLRLTNRACYLDSPAAIMFEFIRRYNYTFRRISRIDIALDFEKFDSGDNPAEFIKRYMKGNIRKCNVTTIRPHGEDTWTGQSWNSISWGAKKSMIGTKLYNKSLELKQVKDKPYIRQAWFLAGLVDDYFTMKKKAQDGSLYEPTIWRLEFSISSSVRGWFRIEDDQTKGGIRSMNNTLDCYFSKQQCLNIFASLAAHYFHFKYPQFKAFTHEPVRKDRCPDKVLFKFTDQEQFYKIDNSLLVSSSDMPAKIDALILKLEAYKMQKPVPEIIKACDCIIESLKKDQNYYSAVRPWDTKKLTMLRQLLSLRMKTDVEFEDGLQQLKKLFVTDENYYGERDQLKGDTVVSPSDFQRI